MKHCFKNQGEACCGHAHLKPSIWESKAEGLPRIQDSLGHKYRQVCEGYRARSYIPPKQTTKPQKKHVNTELNWNWKIEILSCASNWSLSFIHYSASAYFPVSLKKEQSFVFVYGYVGVGHSPQGGQRITEELAPPSTFTWSQGPIKHKSPSSRTKCLCPSQVTFFLLCLLILGFF